MGSTAASKKEKGWRVFWCFRRGHCCMIRPCFEWEGFPGHFEGEGVVGYTVSVWEPLSGAYLLYPLPFQSCCNARLVTYILLDSTNAATVSTTSFIVASWEIVVTISKRWWCLHSGVLTAAVSCLWLLHLIQTASQVDRVWCGAHNEFILFHSAK